MVSQQHPGSHTSILRQRARQALISGILSLLFGAITLVSLIGIAGLFTGTLAIVRGAAVLKQSKHAPGNSGRRAALAAMIMGTVALICVLLSIVIRWQHLAL
jgi:hypothetical protein